MPPKDKALFLVGWNFPRIRIKSSLLRLLGPVPLLRGRFVPLKLGRGIHGASTEGSPVCWEGHLPGGALPGGLVALGHPHPHGSCHSTSVLCHFRKKHFILTLVRNVYWLPRGASKCAFNLNDDSFVSSYIYFIRGTGTCHISILLFLLLL